MRTFWTFSVKTYMSAYEIEPIKPHSAPIAKSIAVAWRHHPEGVPHMTAKPYQCSTLYGRRASKRWERERKTRAAVLMQQAM